MASKESNSSLWTCQRQNKNFIVKSADLNDINQILVLAEKINKDLLSKGFDQWNHGYPNKDTFIIDINDNTQFVLNHKDNIVGLISINPLRNKNFFQAKFRDTSINFRIISRLAIDPDFQSLGLAGEMMKFAENKIISDGFSSIRLGALKNYTKVVEFYNRRNYKIVDEMYVERTNHTYYILEKLLR
jgi:ribosomal protein S18 acetylase RimI-like enzyme